MHFCIRKTTNESWKHCVEHAVTKRKQSAFIGHIPQRILKLQFKINTAVTNYNILHFYLRCKHGIQYNLYNSTWKFRRHWLMYLCVCATAYIYWTQQLVLNRLPTPSHMCYINHFCAKHITRLYATVAGHVKIVQQIIISR